MLPPIVKGGVPLRDHPGAERIHMYAFPLSAVVGAVVTSQAIPLDPVPALRAGDLLLRIEMVLGHHVSEVGGVVAVGFCW